MAIAKEILSSVGPKATYHRISRVLISFEAKSCQVNIAGFWNQATRDTVGMGALVSGELQLTNKRFPFTVEQMQAWHEFLNLSVVQDLCALELVYDKKDNVPMCYFRAVTVKEVAGQEIQVEEQGSVSADKAPIDMLSILYPILLQQPEYANGQNV